MELEIQCEHCLGLGTRLTGNPPGEDAMCPFCRGNGSVTRLRPPTGIFHSADVLGCIDFSEYQGLNANKEKAVSLIISANYIDLNEGSNVRNKLFNCFEEGSSTRTALLALING